MTRKKILTISPIILSLLLIPSFGIVFGEHGHAESSSGGGCSGDCSPPTLGLDNAGIINVKGGFAINGESFDVEHFKQTIPTQFVEENNPVEINLRIFENSGTSNLKHVGVMLGLEEKFTGYSWNPTHPVEISWEQDSEGIEMVEIKNPYDLVKDVDVKVEHDETITTLTIVFTPIEPFDTNTIIVKTWDQNRNTWTNYFFESMEIRAQLISGINELSDALSEPENQEKESDSHEGEKGFHEKTAIFEEFHCGSSFELVYRASNMSPVCVTPYSANVLLEYGWAISGQ